jgi:hypothetical protein
MEKLQVTVAVTGMNATDNPAQGVAVARSLRAEPQFAGRVIGLGYDPLDPGLGSVRVGSTYGLTVDGARLSAKGGPVNMQARPMAFLWIGEHVGLQAGARLTRDDRGHAVSVNAGGSLLLNPVTIRMEGHLGDEYWALGLAGPSIMSFAARTSYGGRATVLWSASKSVQLALQSEGERLRQEGASGVYWSISGGVQISLGTQ